MIVTCIATQILTSTATSKILILVLIVFHRSFCEHPRRSPGETADPSNSSALYLKSEGLNRRDNDDGTRGMIFGRKTIVNGCVSSSGEVRCTYRDCRRGGMVLNAEFNEC
jgi:hypothetical protein